MSLNLSSIAARLAMRQILFMLLIAVMGWYAMQAAGDVRNLARALDGADAATATALGHELLKAAEHATNVLFYSICAGCFTEIGRAHV